MKRFLPVIIFLLLAVLLGVGLKLDPKKVPSPLIGKAAPAFELPLLKKPENSISTDAFKGKVSLLNVWATWCVSCRAEHEVLTAIANTGKVDIYGLNYKDEREAAKKWLQVYGDPYVVSAFDADGRVGIDWGVYGTPETFVIDQQGIIRHKVIGPVTVEIWQEELLPLITKLEQQG
ncbi:MAG TPA: DsbE family thiol:disulfide interchange protein [Chromatiales bacterium]|nr:DsbE family thiol:disulfide interchange protein [Thiotrichales bacterium]HIP66988.1 DsbE family thiol:disulfide interchange protein [Chromatiales bacterium]